MRMLDLFCGRLGWSKAFLARGWECVGVDLVEPTEITQGVEFIKANVECIEFKHVGFTHRQGLGYYATLGHFDFICASSPCEEFSVHGMKHFHPNPKYPENGIRLFNHTREICEASGVPYVMENVRAAQQFVGRAVHHCGPFYLWGTGVPAIMPQGIQKGRTVCRAMRPNDYAKIRHLPDSERIAIRKEYLGNLYSPSKAKTAKAATIPPELANCVADYAGRICDKDSKYGEIGCESGNR